jgi:predicted metal-binding membrane protein
MQREHVLFLAPLLILAAASWALLIWQAGMMTGMGLTMGMGIALFLAVWVVMMIAMMFPATAPMNLAFARVQRERHSGGRSAPGANWAGKRSGCWNSAPCLVSGRSSGCRCYKPLTRCSFALA